MIKKCDVSIAMFDSSWWTIYSKNELFYKKLVSNFKDDELPCSYEFQDQKSKSLS